MSKYLQKNNQPIREENLNWVPVSVFLCSSRSAPGPSSPANIQDMELREEWQDDGFPRSEVMLTEANKDK